MGLHLKRSLVMPVGLPGHMVLVQPPYFQRLNHIKKQLMFIKRFPNAAFLSKQWLSQGY